MSISVGQLHSAHELLDWVSKRQMAKSEIHLFNRVLVCPAKDILNLSLRCGWVEIDMDSNLKLSPRGKELQSKSDFQARMRLQIMDTVTMEQPSWSSLFPKGRLETVNFINQDILQCLNEAGLLDSPPTDEIVSWWDEMAGHVRGVRSSSLTEIGRKGEKLSLLYEQRRTGQVPRWQAVESNLSGFDVLSIVSNKDSAQLQIEVKATERDVNVAEFYITQNEWDTAKLSRNYIFHLWIIASKPKLASVSREEMEKHIPHDMGQGIWQSVKIPFKIFSEKYCFQHT